MRRLDTMNIAAARALMVTIELATRVGGAVPFECYSVNLNCAYCPFNTGKDWCKHNPMYIKRTAEQWQQWANEIIDTDNNKEDN